METVELRPGYAISRVIRGGWQLAGGHGAIDRERAVEDFVSAFDAGLTTFDCADIYAGVEEIYGEVRGRLARAGGAETAARLHVHTKLVPDLAILPRIRRTDVEAIVDTSLRRLRMERLDLVQFHWWDYAHPGWMDVFGWLADLRQAGKIRHVGGTNFDVPRVEAALDAGIPLVSLQVQYSALDRRPEHGLAALCRAHGVHLMCYGSVAGGFLGDRWLGVPEPTGALENRSLVKYKLIIDDFGGWELFQELLRALRRVADRHGTDIATVASRLVLQRPGVAAVIVGARNRTHVRANAAIGALRLTPEDIGEIEAAAARATGPRGDVYTLERDRTGRHGSIMNYNLNTETA